MVICGYCGNLHYTCCQHVRALDTFPQSKTNSSIDTHKIDSRSHQYSDKQKAEINLSILSATRYSAVLTPSDLRKKKTQQTLTYNY